MSCIWHQTAIEFVEPAGEDRNLQQCFCNAEEQIIAPKL